MVASARFCSSPVSATAAQETLKRFQYESIQTLFFLSVFFLPFFPPPLFPSFSFAPIPRPNFFPPHPFLFFILPFSFIVPPPTKFSAFSQVFRVTGSGSKKSRRISSLTESLSRDDYLFVSLSVMHEGRRSGICIYRSTKKRQQRRNSRLIENQLSTIDSVRSKQRFGK